MANKFNNSSYIVVSSSSSSNSNNNNNGQLIGIPTPVTDAFEGRVYTYYIQLSKRPYSSSIPSVNVNVNIIDQGDNGGDLKLFCSLADTTLNQSSLSLVSKHGIYLYL